MTKFVPLPRCRLTPHPLLLILFYLSVFFGGQITAEAYLPPETSATPDMLAATLRKITATAENAPDQYRKDRLYLAHAWLLDRLGKSVTARDLLLKWAEKDPLFADYMLMEAALIAQRTGDTILARKVLFRIVKEFPASPWHNDAYYRLAESYRNDGKNKLAARTFLGYMSHTRSRRLQATLELARVRVAQEDWAKARIGLERILKANNGYRYRLQAALLIVDHPRLFSSFRKSEKLLATMASTLLSNRELKKAFPLIRHLTQKYTRSSDYAQYLYWMGRYHFLSGHYTEALIMYRKAAEQKNSRITIVSYLSTSRILSLTEQDQKALSLLNTLTDDLNDARHDGSVWQTLHNLARRLGKDKEALRYLEQGSRLTHGREQTKLTYQLALLQLRSGKPRDAARNFRKVLNHLPRRPDRDLPDRAEGGFFLGLALEQAGQPLEALRAWSDAAYHRQSYYSHLSMDRLRELAASTPEALDQLIQETRDRYRRLLAGKRQSGAYSALSKIYLLTGDDKAWQAGLDELPLYRQLFDIFDSLEPLPADPPAENNRIDLSSPHTALARARIFQRLGLATPAAVEYSRCSDRFLATELHVDRRQARLQKAYTLARLFQSSGQYPDSFRWGHLILQNYPPSTPFPFMKTSLLRLCYPDNYRSSVLALCRQYHVDPALVYAIILQESRFDPRAHSVVAARGLMQLMPATASSVAKRHRIKFSGDNGDLYDPILNLQLGILYIRGLENVLEHPAAISAAYNAGESQAALWKSLAPEPLDVYYVPEITFGQTREYAIHVLANARMYTYVYPDLTLPATGTTAPTVKGPPAPYSPRP